MAKNKERILIEAQNGQHGDVLSIQMALGLVARMSEGKEVNGETQNVVILVPTRHNATGSTLEETLGASAIKNLLAKKSVRLSNLNTPILRLETVKTFNLFTPCDVLIVVYATSDALDLADDSKANSVIVVPWIIANVEQWRRTWNPKVFRVGKSPDGQPSIQAIATTSLPSAPANEVVREGLIMLAAMVNVSTGLSHPLDKPKAVSLFKLLHKAGETFSAEEVRSWALQNGWVPRHATQLAEVAQAVLAGKRIQGGGEKIYTAATLKKLRERATQRNAASEGDL